MKQLILVFLFGVVSDTLYGQNIDDLQQNLINALSAYRKNLVSGKEDDLLELKKTIENWKELEPNSAVFDDFVFQTHYAYSINNISYKTILKRAKEDFSESLLSKNFKEEELITFANNSELIDLMVADVLSFEYPFKVEIKQKVFDEIEFYNFRKDEIIAEIGAGKGTFSYLVAMLNKGIEIHINEIDRNLTRYIEGKKESNNFKIDIGKIYMARGNKSEIKISKKINKIIIRNSLHHFSQKDEMLQSIKNSLEHEGSVFIYESLKNEMDVTSCKKKMYEGEIKVVMESNGFSLKKEKKIENVILLEYRVDK